MKKPSSNIFFETFAGEFCEIILSLEIPHNINMDSEGNTHEMRMPLTIQGFVMDADEDFIYLSPDGESVNQAFPRRDLKHIQIIEPSNPMQDLLDETPEPEDGSHYN